MLDCRRWEEVRFVATSLCSIVKDGKKYGFLPRVCVQRWEEVRFVAASLCSIVKDGRKYDLLPPNCARVSKMAKSTICCHQFAVLDCQRCEKVRFVATSLCSIVKDGKKYDLLPPVCARLSKMGGSTICCHQVVLNEGKKYDLSTMGRSTICCHQFVLKDGKKYDLLPPVCGARLSKMGRSSICCHKFVLECQRWEVRFVATSLCWIAKDGKKYDLLPPVCAQRWEEVRFVATSLCSKVGKSTICCHQFEVLDRQRWEKVRFVATSLRCWIVKDGKKNDLLPPVCARCPKMGRRTICYHQFAVLDCQRWEKVRFVATSLCSIVKDEKKYDLLPPVFAQRWEEVRFVAASLCSLDKDKKKYGLLPPVCARFPKMGKIRFVATSLRSSVKDGKRYDLLPPVCARLSKMGRSTICCHQFAVLDCRRWEEVRFVATSLCSIVKDGKKYGFLPPVCAQRWEEVRCVATSLCPSVKDEKKYDLLPPVCRAGLSKMGRSTICCHQLVLECQRWEKVRFVATSLCSKMGRSYDLLPPVCARLSKMGKSTICCHQFAVLDCQRWEEVRFVATSLCSSVKDGKSDLLPPACAGLPKKGRSTFCCHQFVLDFQRWEKYDLLPPVCGARVSKMGRGTICCHQFVLECQRWEEVRFVATSWRRSIVKDVKKYGLLQPVCARLSKMGRSTVFCHEFVLKGGKKYDLLPPVCARLSKMGGSTICCHQFVPECQRWQEVRFVPPVCGARLSKM